MDALTTNPNLEFITAHGRDTVSTLPFSTNSKWGDNEWEIDDKVPGTAKRDKIIKWSQKLPDGSLLTDPQNALLLETCKRLIYLSLTIPLVNSKVLHRLTARRVALNLFVLIRWMFTKGYRKFRDLDQAAIDQYVAYCRTRPGRGRNHRVKATTIHNLSMVIQYLYILRNRLPDAIQFQPFGGEPTSTVTGSRVNEREPTPYIPDEIAVDILRKALSWVERYADDIIEARIICYSEYERALLQGFGRDYARRQVIRALSTFTPASSIVSDLPKQKLFQNKGIIRTLVDHLTTACFICIAGLVGMRISEILSLEPGFIQIERSDDGLTELVYVCGSTYKTEDDPHGRPTRWIAPSPIKTVARVLERLYAITPKKTGESKFFILNPQPKKWSDDEVNIPAMNYRINRFAEFIEVPKYRSVPWHFTTHQFRKTFARFVGRRDKTGLHALSQHFKHVSIAMTDYYAGSDFELYELIGDALVDEMRESLDKILGAESLAGKMGEEILKQNHRFRGRAGEELRRDFVDFIMSETDLLILAHDYALCAVNLDTALCGGDMALVGRGTCVRCPNFMVGEQHRPFWTDQEKRNTELLDRHKDLSPLAKAAIMSEVKQASDILIQLDRQKPEHKENACE
jgi:integrase